MEPVEKWPGVARHRALGISSGERALQQADVARDDFRIQAQLDGAEEQLGGVQVPAQRVARLLQQVAGVPGIALGPEVGGDLIAADAAATGRSEERKHGERLPALPCSGAGSTIDLD